ncbi:mannosyltransferase [Aeromicrobium chenweiae]|uniref:Mannosyltransferase n=1 Tax=Aeromicrobium chenweiae TaxID=2079793 RepID=A0A2S0WRY2_9ACTN|nr:mannosyltransferase [Aeromicrobium chenweiae]TGN33050.1 glycosyltransferase [Aeromicrobium chenweiae]
MSIVIPVYRGGTHLPDLLQELEPLTEPHTTAAGHTMRVTEVILVHDCGPDDSDHVLREASEKHEWILPVWLSRNFGQHPATIAGMASSSGDWIVTMDEDGQHDPADIDSLLDTAMAKQARLVYAAPVNPAPHSAFRNVTSRTSKRVINLIAGGTDAAAFHSFRLVLGEVGRSVAAYAGHGVYLDVALTWVTDAPATAPVTLRAEGDRQSGYSTLKLLSHFWRMVLTSGTRGLRAVSLLGVVLAVLGAAVACYFVIARLNGDEPPQGWTSLVVLLLLMGGVILFSLGVIAEYVGVAVSMAMGKPPYLITSDPQLGPLGRAPDGVAQS